MFFDICIRATFASAGDVDNSRVLFGVHRPVIKFSVAFIFHDDRRCHNKARSSCFYVNCTRIVSVISESLHPCMFPSQFSLVMTGRRASLDDRQSFPWSNTTLNET